MSTDKSCTTASRKSILKSTSILSVGTFCSRVLGFIRDMIFANMLGTAAMADAFFVAFRIPNMLRDLVGEGATNSALVPVLSEYVEKKDIKKTNEFLNAVVSWAILILGGLTILGIIFAPLVVRVIAPGFSTDDGKLQTTINLTRIMFPYLIFIGLTAYSMGVLYTYHSFVVPAFSSCFLNIILIVSTIIAGQYIDHAVYILAVGVLLGGVAQLVYQWIPLRKLGLRWQKPLTLRHDGAIKMGKLLMPRLWGSAVYQSNVFVDTFCASLSSIVGAGGISAIYYSSRVIQFPLGIFGVALASATLPALSGYAVRKDYDGLRSTVLFSLKNILFMLLPSSVLAMVLAVPIVRVVFERGQFGQHSTMITADALGYYAIGLWAFGAMKITVCTFHALQDTRTPVKTAGVGLLLNLILNFVLMYPLKVGGIALASSLSGIAGFLMLFYLLHKKIGGLASEIIDFFWKMSVPLLILAIMTLWVYNIVLIENLWIKLGVAMVAGILSFLGAAWIFKIEQAVACVNWLSKRFK
jgi:putative peptidoglycan lipid II flippase